MIIDSESLKLPGWDNVPIKKPSENLIYCESDDHRVYFLLLENKIVDAGISLTEIHNRLDKKIFFRFRESTVFNMTHAVNYAVANSIYLLLMDNGELFVITRKYANDFKNTLKRFPYVVQVSEQSYVIHANLSSRIDIKSNFAKAFLSKLSALKKISKESFK